MPTSVFSKNYQGFTDPLSLVVCVSHFEAGIAAAIVTTFKKHLIIAEKYINSILSPRNG